MVANCPSGSKRSLREHSRLGSLRCGCKVCAVGGLTAFLRGHISACAPRDSEPRVRGPSVLLLSVFTSRVADSMGWLILCKAVRRLTLLISTTAKPELEMTVTVQRHWRGSEHTVRTFRNFKCIPQWDFAVVLMGLLSVGFLRICPIDSCLLSSQFQR